MYVNAGNGKKAIPIYCLASDDLKNSDNLTPKQKTWLEEAGFTGASGQMMSLPDGDGAFSGKAFGLGPENGRSPLVTGLAASQLSPGTYELHGALDNPLLAALGFRLGSYKFEHYRESTDPVILSLSTEVDQPELDRLVDAAFVARDLINMAPNDLGPETFEVEVRAFSKARKMRVRAIVGDDLLKQNFPMIHAVGRASAEAPRLLELRWGKSNAPAVTLVGKGVTFDTGGLDIKPPAGMLLMKKDMGGAANVLGLAHAIVDAKLKVNLRVLLPIVENAISGAAFRPGDVLPSRAGMNVEIGNTDAEGRLILADALTHADEENPEMIIDMATLTGAARVALGPELPPFYTHNEGLASELHQSGILWDDPLWRLPLWAPYDQLLASKVADINHISSGPFAGSITAALFLQRFVKQAKDWVHLDIFGWAPTARAGRSQGGTDQGIRALYHTLKQRYGGDN
jgi:leucyl aminopeptidase